MKAEDKSFYFLATPSYYDIPFFQRAYVWNEENWSELFGNLTSKTTNHFLGSIILKNELAAAGSVARFSVIDGQQRLTTLSILLRACYDHIVKNAARFNYDESDVKTCQVQMESILFVPEGGIRKKLHVKINHSHLDKKAFENVITGNLDKDDRWERYAGLGADEECSNIVKAYAYFRDELEDTDQDTIDYLWELLTVDKIKFLVNIDLDVNDNEQAIFDTVNSAGVRLSCADTIKNLLYQKYVELLRVEDPNNADDRAIKEYEDTWVDAFIADEKKYVYWEALHQYGRMRRSTIETFLHAFAVIEGFFNAADNTMSELPQEYRNKILNMNLMEMEVFLMDLHDYAEVYEEFFSDVEEELEYSDYIGRTFNICNVLEVSTFHPYLLKQLYAFKKGIITEDELRNNFFGIEKYVILNAICKGSTKNYNKECIQLVDNRKTPSEVMDSCAYITEQRFVDGLRRMTTNKIPTLLLFWVELYQRQQLNVDVIRLKYGFTLEHIMPQKWEKNWSDVPSYDREGDVVEETDDIERVRSQAIYEIGNMTLLNSKLNTSISNGKFYDKINGKAGKKGIKDLADLRITRDIIGNDDWNENKIYARTLELENKIREIWDAQTLPKEVLIKERPENVGRKKLRYSFWEKALPGIREKNNQEAFIYVNPGTSNVVSCSVGISGFNICCVANYDKARVDLVFSKRVSEDNKKAFDILYKHKDEIENKLNINLIWERADDYKSSWISHNLEGVSIANEGDWLSMAEFLGEWSCKIRRIMLPYLQEEFYQDILSVRSPQEVERLSKIAEILREWTIKNDDVIERIEKSNRTCTRFTTSTMSKILPDLKDAPSGWNTDNHYFYEIVNRTGKDVDIKLSFSSRNMTEDQRNLIYKIGQVINSKPAKENWQWWVAFRTEKVVIPEDLNKEIIFKGLNSALGDISDFEGEIQDTFGL